MTEIEKEEIDGIYANAFPSFSQNSLVCRYGFLAKYGSIHDLLSDLNDYA